MRVARNGIRVIIRILCGTTRPSVLLIRGIVVCLCVIMFYQFLNLSDLVASNDSVQLNQFKRALPRTVECKSEAFSEQEMFSLLNPGITGGQPEFGHRAPRKVLKTGEENDELFVVIAPFSHVDPGWLETFTEYTRITNEIINHAVDFITANPRMTFQWTEMIFLKAWWTQASQDKRSTLKKLISDGNIELTSGSLVMTDEASAHYWASIDNIVEGHRFLVDEMGLKGEDLPKIAFSNDPFGYGPTVPYLFSKSGVKDLVVQRIGREWKAQFGGSKHLEFLWRQSWDRSHSNDVLTHAMAYPHYDIVNSCGPETQVCCQFDFRRVRQYRCPGPKPTEVTTENVEQKAKLLVNALRQHSQVFPLNTVLFMFGDDFRFNEYWEWELQYENLVKIIDHINENKEFEVKVNFGTLSTYFVELKNRMQDDASLPSLTGDFFPYSDVGNDYWTGYYTTRPVNKRLDRTLQSNLRTADVLLALTSPFRSNVNADINMLASAHSDLALFQHHDAITGTSRPHVAADYAKRLVDAIRLAQNMSALSVRILHHLNEDPVPLVVVDTTVNALKPVAIELTDQSTPAKLLLVNSLAHARRFTVRVRVRNSLAGLAVLDSAGTEVPSQVNPAVDISTAVFRVVDGEVELAMNVDLPALSMTVYSIKQRDSLHNFAKILQPASVETRFNDKRFKLHDPPQESLFGINLGNQSAIYNSKTGIIRSVQINNELHEISIEHLAYYNTKSGAYVFKPSQARGSQQMIENITNLHQLWISIAGHLVADTYSVYENLIHFSSLISEEGSVVHYGNVLDVRKENSAEIVMRLNVNVKNEEHVFYTDSNGFQVMKRQYSSTRAEQANYYPMATTAFLEDAEFRCTVNTAHPVGVTGQRGMLQFMLDRKLRLDDRKGIGIGFVPNDNLPTRSDFVVRFEKRTEKISRYVSLSYSAQHDSNALLSPPMAFTVPSSVDSDLFTITAPSLPCSLDLIALRYLSAKDPRVLLTLRRTQHDCGIRPEWNACEATDDTAVVELVKFMGFTKAQAALLSSVQSPEQESETMSASEIVDKLKSFEVESFILLK